MSSRWLLRKERERIILNDREQDGVDDPYSAQRPVDEEIKANLVALTGSVEMTEAEQNLTIRDMEFEKIATTKMRAMRRSRNA
jgi:hypothetical protein